MQLAAQRIRQLAGPVAALLACCYLAAHLPAARGHSPANSLAGSLEQLPGISDRRLSPFVDPPIAQKETGSQHKIEARSVAVPAEQRSRQQLINYGHLNHRMRSAARSLGQEEGPAGARASRSRKLLKSGARGLTASARRSRARAAARALKLDKGRALAASPMVRIVRSPRGAEGALDSTEESLDDSYADEKPEPAIPSKARSGLFGAQGVCMCPLANNGEQQGGGSDGSGGGGVTLAALTGGAEGSTTGSPSGAKAGNLLDSNQPEVGSLISSAQQASSTLSGGESKKVKHDNFSVGFGPFELFRFRLDSEEISRVELYELIEKAHLFDLLVEQLKLRDRLAKVKADLKHKLPPLKSKLKPKPKRKPKLDRGRPNRKHRNSSVRRTTRKPERASATAAADGDADATGTAPTHPNALHRIKKHAGHDDDAAEQGPETQGRANDGEAGVTIPELGPGVGVSGASASISPGVQTSQRESSPFDALKGALEAAPSGPLRTADQEEAKARENTPSLFSNVASSSSQVNGGPPQVSLEVSRGTTPSDIVTTSLTSAGSPSGSLELGQQQPPPQQQQQGQQGLSLQLAPANGLQLQDQQQGQQQGGQPEGQQGDGVTPAGGFSVSSAPGSLAVAASDSQNHDSHEQSAVSRSSSSSSSSHSGESALTILEGDGNPKTSGQRLVAKTDEKSQELVSEVLQSGNKQPGGEAVQEGQSKEEGPRASEQQEQQQQQAQQQEGPQGEQQQQQQQERPRQQENQPNVEGAPKVVPLPPVQQQQQQQQQQLQLPQQVSQKPPQLQQVAVKYPPIMKEPPQVLVPKPQTQQKLPLYESPRVEALPHKCRAKLRDLIAGTNELLGVIELIGQKTLADGSIDFAKRDLLSRKLAKIRTAAEESLMAANLAKLQLLNDTAKLAGIELIRLSNLKVALKLEPRLKRLSAKLRKLYGAYRKACKGVGKPPIKDLL